VPGSCSRPQAGLAPRVRQLLIRLRRSPYLLRRRSAFLRLRLQHRCAVRHSSALLKPVRAQAQGNFRLRRFPALPPGSAPAELRLGRDIHWGSGSGLRRWLGWLRLGLGRVGSRRFWRDSSALPRLLAEVAGCIRFLRRYGASGSAVPFPAPQMTARPRRGRLRFGGRLLRQCRLDIRRYRLARLFRRRCLTGSRLTGAPRRASQHLARAPSGGFLLR
jgi:hypothetical protein